MLPAPSLPLTPERSLEQSLSGFLMMPLPHDTTIISLPSLGIIHVADMSLLNPTTVDLSGNIITIYTCPSSFLNVTTFNISSNKLNLASIASILHVIALSGSVCAVDVSGKDMASHSTWTSTMLADETTITNNGGSVHSQP